MEELRGHKVVPEKSKLKELRGHKVVPVRSKLRELRDHKAIPVKLKLGARRTQSRTNKIKTEEQRSHKAVLV